jgi:hypothetical protein
MDKLKLLNSSSLNFNLREPNKNKSTNIYAVIKINKKQIKIATELKINSWQWDKKKQIPILLRNKDRFLNNQKKRHQTHGA